MGIDRRDVYITNIVKCRPPGNRNQAGIELDTCGAFLQEQIEIIDPKILVFLGNVPKSYFLGQIGGITKVRGTWHSWKGRQAFLMYHPSYLLRNESRGVGSPKWETWQDIKELKRRLDELTAVSETPEQTVSEEKEEEPPSEEDRGQQLKLF